MEAGCVVSALFFTVSSLVSSIFAETIIKCVKGLSPIGDSRCQRYTKTLAFVLLRSYTMFTPSSGAAGIGAGGERLDVHGDLGGMSKIQQQLVVLYRQLRQLATLFTGNERQRAEEAATAAAIQVAQKAEVER